MQFNKLICECMEHIDVIDSIESRFTDRVCTNSTEDGPDDITTKILVPAGEIGVSDLTMSNMII